MRRPTRGFTLIELLIAILVFSILGFTVTSRISGIANQAYQMERRAVAHWVAQNQLHRLQLTRYKNTEPLVTGNDTERGVHGQPGLARALRDGDDGPSLDAPGRDRSL